MELLLVNCSRKFQSAREPFVYYRISRKVFVRLTSNFQTVLKTEKDKFYLIIVKENVVQDINKKRKKLIIGIFHINFEVM